MVFPMVVGPRLSCPAHRPGSRRGWRAMDTDAVHDPLPNNPPSRPPPTASWARRSPLRRSRNSGSSLELNSVYNCHHRPPPAGRHAIMSRLPRRHTQQYKPDFVPKCGRARKPNSPRRRYALSPDPGSGTRIFLVRFSAHECSPRNAGPWKCLYMMTCPLDGRYLYHAGSRGTSSGPRPARPETIRVASGHSTTDVL